MMAIYGYARVSTKGQDLSLQVESLKNSGVEERSIFKEKISGAKIKEEKRSLLVSEKLTISPYVCYNLII